ncbi:MAG: homocysteine S-methyltransferase, partial [Streptomyces sp.]|uniref:homocysteine S-methyltransferase n=1 Tax=Streptomyces sp. TaxID=1931 RepID=UPI003D6A62BB
MTRPPFPLGAALARGPLVLDGGLSDQLAAQGCDLSGELWTARLLADDPGQIEAAHAAYLRAGARVLITGSYQASFEGFGRHGSGRREAGALFRRSVRLARAAAARVEADAGADAGTGAAGPVWVAASLGPYGATRAGGGEYLGRYGLSVRELADFHRPRVAALAEAEPDVFALETVPDVDEAEAMLRAVRGCGVPVWLSYTIDGRRTRAGQPLADAFAVAAGQDQVVAVGVNCCAAADVDHAIEVAAATTGKPVVVYPNSGERWTPRAAGTSTRGGWHGAATFAPGAGAAGGAG